MRDGWKELKLGSFAKVISGYAFKSKDLLDDAEIPVIKIGNIKHEYVDLNITNSQFVHDLFLKKLNEKYVISEGDLLISLTGSHLNQPNSVVGRVALYRHDHVALLNQRAGKVIIKDKTQIDKLFLFYLLSTNSMRVEIALRAFGAANQANVSPSDIENIKFKLPPLPLQTRIADLLSAYDELIEVNNRRIALLEQTAEQLYKEWFVRLRFPGYAQTKVRKGVPEGWEVTKLKSVLETKNGKSLPKVEHYEIEAAPELFPVFGSNGLIGQSNKFNTEDALIVGRVGAYCGSINFQPGKLWATDNTIIANSKTERFTNEFARFFLKAINLRNFASGSAQPMLTQGIIKNQELLLPPLKLVSKFTTIVKTLNNQKQTLQTQNQTLRRTRDLLLPRLISGQLSVAEAETALNA